MPYICYPGRTYMTRNKELGVLYTKKAADRENMKALTYRNKRETGKFAPRKKLSEPDPTFTSSSKDSTPNAADSTAGNNDEDGIDALLANISKKEPDVPLVHKYEYGITWFRSRYSMVGISLTLNSITMLVSSTPTPKTYPKEIDGLVLSDNFVAGKHVGNQA